MTPEEKIELRKVALAFLKEPVRIAPGWDRKVEACCLTVIGDGDCALGRERLRQMVLAHHGARS